MTTKRDDGDTTDNSAASAAATLREVERQAYAEGVTEGRAQGYRVGAHEAWEYAARSVGTDPDEAAERRDVFEQRARSTPSLETVRTFVGRFFK